MSRALTMKMQLLLGLGGKAPHGPPQDPWKKNIEDDVRSKKGSVGKVQGEIILVTCPLECLYRSATQLHVYLQ